MENRGNGKPTYYAVIPAEVRYNSKLTANAKLLYGEITALCSSQGFCWANNRYFAALYGVSTKTITTWLNSLKNCGIIEIKYIATKGGKDLSRRKIFLVHTPGRKLPTPQKKTSWGARRKGDGGWEENFPHINTKNTTTITTLNDFEEKKNSSNNFEAGNIKNQPTVEEVADYCIEKSLYFNYEEFYTVNETKYHWAKPWKESISKWCATPHLMPEYYIIQDLYLFVYNHNPKSSWLSKYKDYSYTINNESQRKLR